MKAFFLALLVALFYVSPTLAAEQPMVEGDPATLRSISSGEAQRLLRASANGDMAARQKLTAMFDKPLPYPLDFRNGILAREFYQFGADIGNPRAMYFLGNLCAGPPVKDAACTEKWHRLSAEKGDPDAMASLASGYRNDPNKDVEKALFWERKAAEAGHVLSMEYMARRYEEGDGVDKSREMADYWYGRAEAKGARTPAVVKRENAARVAELKRGVEQDDADAMFQLGKAYVAGGFYGWGLTRDYAEAMRLYKSAASLGHAAAANNVGMMYGRGLGVERDPTAAMRWYRLSAEKGSIRSMFNIGGMEERGESAPADPVAALAWYQVGIDHMAADGSNWGFEIGVAMSLVSSMCDLRSRMSPAELTKATLMQKGISSHLKNDLAPSKRLSQASEFRRACR